MATVGFDVTPPIKAAAKDWRYGESVSNPSLVPIAIAVVEETP